MLPYKEKWPYFTDTCKKIETKQIDEKENIDFNLKTKY